MSGRASLWFRRRLTQMERLDRRGATLFLRENRRRFLPPPWPRGRVGRPYFYLRDDEQVLLRVRPPFSYAIVLSLVPIVVLTALLVIALVLLPAVPQVPRSTPWLVWGVLVALVALAAWRRQATTEYALTDERIYTRSGRLVTRLHFTTHDKITDMRFRQGPLQRAFGLSSLSFATAGGDVQVSGIPNAMAVKGAAEMARDAFIRRLLTETTGGATPVPSAQAREKEAISEAASAQRTSGATPVMARPVAEPWTGARPDYLQGGDEPVWSARPRPVAALGALRSLLGLIPFLFFTSFMDGPRGVWIPLAATGLVLMFIAVRFMQLRRTEYMATERRVYARQGLIGTTVNQLTYDKITDITFHQDILGKIFGYGSVTLQTAGSNQAPITMIGLAAPLAAKETVERWRDAAVAR